MGNDDLAEKDEFFVVWKIPWRLPIGDNITEMIVDNINHLMIDHRHLMRFFCEVLDDKK